jgi:hypothetical protein
MLENMSGFVGHAAHEERHRQAHTHRRGAELKPTVSPWSTAYRRSRTTLATALLTIAARIAPVEPMPKRDTAPVAR